MRAAAAAVSAASVSSRFALPGSKFEKSASSPNRSSSKVINSPFSAASCTCEKESSKSGHESQTAFVSNPIYVKEDNFMANNYLRGINFQRKAPQEITLISRKICQQNRCPIQKKHQKSSPE